MSHPYRYLKKSQTTDEGGGGEPGSGHHPDLTGRTFDGQHPTSAITGLDTAQAAQDTAIATHTHDGGTTAKIAHTDLEDRYTADQHRIANITGLENEQAAQDAEIAEKVGAPWKVEEDSNDLYPEVVAAPTTYLEELVSTYGAIRSWALDDASEPIIESVVGAPVSAIGTITYEVQGPSVVPEGLEKAILTDNSSYLFCYDRAVVPVDMQSLGSTTNGFTAGGWVKTLSNGGFGSYWYTAYPLMELKQETTTETKVTFSLGVDTGGVLACGIAWDGTSGWNKLVSALPVINDDNWHFIAVVRDGATITLYVDGVAEAFTISNVDMSPGTVFTNLTIAANTNNFGGVLSSVRGSFAGFFLSPSILTGPDILNLYNLGINPAVARSGENSTPGLGTVDNPVGHLGVGVQGADGVEGIVAAKTDDQGGLHLLAYKGFDPATTPTNPIRSNAPIELNGNAVLVTSGNLWIEISQAITSDHEVILGPSISLADGRIFSPLQLGPEKVYANFDSATSALDVDVADNGWNTIAEIASLNDDYPVGISTFFYQLRLSNTGGKDTIFTVEVLVDGTPASSKDYILNVGYLDISESGPIDIALSTGATVTLRVEGVTSHAQAEAWVLGSEVPSQIFVRK